MFSLLGTHHTPRLADGLVLQVCSRAVDVFHQRREMPGGEATAHRLADYVDTVLESNFRTLLCETRLVMMMMMMMMRLCRDLN